MEPTYHLMPKALRKAIADFDQGSLAQVLAVPPQRSIQESIYDRLNDLVDRSRLQTTFATTDILYDVGSIEEVGDASSSRPAASMCSGAQPEGGLLADIARFDRDSLKKVVLPPPRSIQESVIRDLMLMFRPTRPTYADYWTAETSFNVHGASADEDVDDEDSDVESDWSDLVDEVDDDGTQDNDDKAVVDFDFLLVQRTQPTFHPAAHAELLAAIRKRVPKCTRSRTRRRSLELHRRSPVVARSRSPLRLYPVPILRCPDLTRGSSLSLSEASEWSDDD
ncbi:hypothetical protein SDRG_02582 [Saprolegnia diclina VS20]|uniref:Uncharacterized protein n=1 Tax=Saprolegnia diclina (strain VS20) TaxID=1156394 RepID=T0QZ05_SAPDV|nr:hypothetical protein SDRG_02582 [Saprolegnia diclina VS20]EQC39926.1 hypothetical protein SDRG_02582 [Saprolegnia diclina VS20]|eukprot:XP_008606400.1 hypothetical protein SDRG_02582 [Saprolegnia diclina VS20]